MRILSQIIHYQNRYFIISPLPLISLIQHLRSLIDLQINLPGVQEENGLEQPLQRLRLLRNRQILLILRVDLDVDIALLLILLATDLKIMALFDILKHLLHLLQLLSVYSLPHTLEVHRNHLEVALIQYLIIQLTDEILVLAKINGILPDQILYLLIHPSKSVQHQILNNLIDLRIDLRHSMIKRLLYILYILLKQFGQNRQIPIPESYLIDIGVLLPQHSHYIINVGQNELILILAHQRLLLE